RALARAPHDFDATAVSAPYRGQARKRGAQPALLERGTFQSEPDFPVEQCCITPLRVCVQIEFLAGHIGPAVFLYQLPERRLRLDQPLGIFPIGTDFDQDSVGAMEGPVMS